MKITLENGQEVEISKESYEALLNTVQEKEWEPRYGHKYHYLGSDGYIYNIHWDDEEEGNFRLATGNCFSTKEKAEMYKKRLLAREGRFLPKKGEGYWTIDNRKNAVDVTWRNDYMDIKNYEIGACRKTEEEIIKWKEEFYEAFEDLIK